MTSYPKTQYYRSKAITNGCRLLACQHCGVEDGTVCAAHSNWGQHGKGFGIKADDRYVAALCFRCHSQLDQGGMWTGDMKRSIWLAAHTKTVDLLVIAGVWPSHIPLPQ